jgi:hypothetical protein
MTCLSAWTTGRARKLAFGLALCGVASACGAAGGMAGDGSARSLPVWDAQAREVFDDNIEPAAVGLTMEGKTVRNDPLLRERARSADLVARVRVSTVTVETLEQKVTYRLVVQVVPPPFNTPAISGTSFEIAVGPEAHAYGIAKAFDTRLRGASFIGFLRYFAGGEGGEPEVHWHFSPDSAEVAAAVRDALALAELSGS